MVKTKSLKGAFLAGLLVVISFWAGFSLNSYWQEKNSSTNFHRPQPPSPTPLPLLAYSPALKVTPITADTITLEKIITTGQTSLSVLFSYQVAGKKISGLANFPTTAPAWGGILSQCLPQTYNVPVSGQQKNAFYKGLFIIVPAYILIFQKPDQRLGRRQTYRFHFILPFIALYCRSLKI